MADLEGIDGLGCAMPSLCLCNSSLAWTPQCPDSSAEMQPLVGCVRLERRLLIRQVGTFEFELTTAIENYTKRRRFHAFASGEVA